MEMKLKKFLALFSCAAVAFSFNACDDDDDDNGTPEPIPTKVEVKSISAVQDSSFTVNVEISGDDSIMARGVFLSTSAISDDSTLVMAPVYAANGGNGFFTMNLNKLIPETKYYIRAFGKNQSGSTTLSQLDSVTTLSHEATKVAVSKVVATDGSLTVTVDVSGQDKVVLRGAYISDKVLSEEEIKSLTPIDAKEAGNGTFEVVFDKLMRNTEYHIIAYAKDETGKITYSAESVEKTTATEKGTLEIDVTNGENDITAVISANDPLTKVVLKKMDGSIFEATSTEESIKDAMYIYTVKFAELNASEYTIVAETANAKEEAAAATGLYRLDFNLEKISQDSYGSYIYRSGDVFGTLRVYSGSVSLLNPKKVDYIKFDEGERTENNTISMSANSYIYYDNNYKLTVGLTMPEENNMKTFLGRIISDASGKMTFSGEGITKYTKAQ